MLHHSRFFPSPELFLIKKLYQFTCHAEFATRHPIAVWFDAANTSSPDEIQKHKLWN